MFLLHEQVADQIAQDAALDQLADTAEQIAQGTARRAKDSDYRNSVVVKKFKRIARVTSDNSFAHLDEFGSVNNPPTAAMRTAAAENGRFVPD